MPGAQTEMELPSRTKEPDWLRVVNLLRQAGAAGLTTRDLTLALINECMNLTGRISDARKRGFEIVQSKEKGANGTWRSRYRLVREPGWCAP